MVQIIELIYWPDFINIKNVHLSVDTDMTDNILCILNCLYMITFRILLHTFGTHQLRMTALKHTMKVF